MGELTLIERIRARAAHLWLVAFYFVTAWLPRRFPENEAEWLNLRFTLIDYFGVEDKPANWGTIAGHVMSTPSYRRRRSYQYLANVAQRLSINALANDVKQKSYAELKTLLDSAMAKVAADAPLPEQRA